MKSAVFLLILLRLSALKGVLWSWNLPFAPRIRLFQDDYRFIADDPSISHVPRNHRRHAVCKNWMKPALLYYIEQLSKRTVETLDPWLGELEWQVNKLTSGVFVFFTALQVGQCPEEFGIITLIYNAVSCCWNEIDLSAKLKPPIFCSFAHTAITGPWAKFKAKHLARSPTTTSLHCLHWLRRRRLAASWIQQPWLALHFFAALPLKWHAITMWHPPWKEPQNWHLTKDGCEVAPGSLVIDAPSSSFFFLMIFNCCEASSDETHMKDAEDSQEEAQNEQQSFSSTHPYLDSQWASAIHVAHNGPCHCPKHKLA